MSIKIKYKSLHTQMLIGKSKHRLGLSKPVFQLSQIPVHLKEYYTILQERILLKSILKELLCAVLKDDIRKNESTHTI